MCAIGCGWRGATTDILHARRAARDLSHQRRHTGVINILCDRAMLGAYTQELHQVPESLVRRAGSEIFDREFMRGGRRSVLGLAAVDYSPAAAAARHYASNGWLPGLWCAQLIARHRHQYRPTTAPAGR